MHGYDVYNDFTERKITRFEKAKIDFAYHDKPVHTTVCE